MNKIIFPNPHNLELPVNFKEEDYEYFEPHFGYVSLTPRIEQFKNVFYFKNRIAINLLGKKIESNLPWRDWGQNIKRLVWYKRIIKAALNRNLGLLINNKTPFVIVADPFSDNYFHWMTEVIPKILKIKESIQDFTVLLPAILNQPYQVETLQLIGVGYRTFYKDGMFLRKVFICSPSSLFTGYTSPQEVEAIRNAFKSDIRIYKKKRIYLSREMAPRRKVINESEIIPSLLAEGFEVIYPEELSFWEIIRKFRDAEMIISPHGAALTNMIFAESGALILELRIEKIITDKCYYILANSCNHKYFYQNCVGHGQTNDHVNSNIWVDKEELKRNIHLMKTLLN